MKPLEKLAILSFVVLIQFFIITSAFADVVGEFTFIDGRVDILIMGQKMAAPVEVGAPVSIGDIVRTKSNSRAEITFMDNTVIRLAQNTRVEISDYLFDNRGAREKGILSLFRGKIRALVSRPFKIIPVAFVGVPDFEVHTPNAVAGVRGTDFYSIHDLGVSWFYVRSGGLWSFMKDSPDEVVFIKRRNCIRVAPGKPLQGSCTYRDLDVKRHERDTSTSGRLTAAAELPSEDVFTYTPPVGAPEGETPTFEITTITTAPLPILLPPVYLPPEPDTTTTKMGDFKRIE